MNADTVKLKTLGKKNNILGIFALFGNLSSKNTNLYKEKFQSYKHIQRKTGPESIVAVGNAEQSSADGNAYSLPSRGHLWLLQLNDGIGRFFPSSVCWENNA